MARKPAGAAELVFAEEFLRVFYKADEDDDGGAGEADEKHDLKDVHGE
jgi:hypothetical protein